ncbi:MAG: hypothetical protein H6R21_2298 [Proteobacteria bacterium]|nr:hypothetical protein [Pseudomonadota bacterium]
MNANAAKTWLCLFVFMLLPIAASAAGLKEDMVALDRAFIPAFGIANRTPPQPEEAKRAMDAFSAQWAGFKQQHMATKGGDPQWQSDLEQIDRLIGAADRIIDSGKDFAKAREQLKAVRVAFLELRERMKMPYFLDDVVRFHDPMEAIHLIARGKTGEQLTAADVAKITGTFSEADQRWATVQGAKIDAVFAPTAERRDRLNKLIANETRAMADLQRDLAAGDREAIAKSAQGLRGPFSALYSSFGDRSALDKN